MVDKTDVNPDTPYPQEAPEQEKLQPENSSPRSSASSPKESRNGHSDATSVEPLAPNNTDVEVAQPNGAEGKRPKSPKQKRLIKMLKRKEIIFFLIGGVTFSLGLILVIVALLIMQGKCEKQPYWVNGESPPSFDASVNGQQGDNDIEYVISHQSNSTLPAINLAEGKPVFQSSTSVSATGYQYNATLATDGNQSKKFSRGLCTQTDNQPQPFWYVDLGSMYLVRHVKIALPSDCCVGEVHDFEVRIGQHEDFGTNYLCKHFMGTALNLDLDINCDSQLNGRYVSIQMLGDASRTMDRLTLCEVMVYST